MLRICRLLTCMANSFPEIYGLEQSSQSVGQRVCRLCFKAEIMKVFCTYDLLGNSYFFMPNVAGIQVKRSVERVFKRSLVCHDTFPPFLLFHNQKPPNDVAVERHAPTMD